jgi:AcrR family transcriptional regulator
VSSPTDLTARARIREAALTLFAAKGIDGATIRDIAQAAGVSSGLLRHHFGSKEGLRDACDDYVMAELARVRAPYLAGNQTLGAQAMSNALNSVPLRLQNYVVRSTMDGTPAGAQMFERNVDEAATWLAHSDIETDDPRAYCAVLVSLQMGMFLMRDRISATIGDDTHEPVGQARMLRAAVDIFAQPLLPPEMAADARAALDRLITAQE